MIKIIRHFEQGDRVTCENKKYKVVKRIGYYDNTKEQLIYDYILFDGEDIITVSENEISEAE